MFLGAILHWRAGSSPVNIRNISPTGALVEGLIGPEPGESLVLKRGELSASGIVVWKAGRKAGITFSSVVFVSDWVSKRASPHQERVDGVIMDVRSGSRSDHIAEKAALLPLAAIEAELVSLKCYLTELEDGLMGDVVIVATHPEIQLLDVAQQSVNRMLLKLGQA